jgi:two-component system, OmpR family, sensor histidine kinase CpxA
VTIAVSDDGPGVPEGELPTLFYPFTRPDASRTRNTGGVGLGLAIVRSAVEACGGSVACRNLVPRGFEVSLRLRSA